MSKISSKYQLNEIVALSVLKRKFKQYMKDAGLEGFKSSVFPKYLVVSLVMVLEELLTECLEHIKKHETNGLYVIDQSMVLMVLNKSSKYDVFIKYIKKYNSTIKYQESVMFNYRKVIDDLESKYGDKLMVDSEAKNFISYLLVSLQYELIKLSLAMVVYSNRKTMSAESLLTSLKFLFEEMYSKIKLKLDSMVQTKDTEDGEEVEEGEEGEEEAELEDGKELEHDKQVEQMEHTASVKVTKTEDDVQGDNEEEKQTKKTKPSKKKVVVEKKEVMDDDLENDLDKELENVEIETNPKNNKSAKKSK
jgi:hypothetical protein